MAMLWGTDHIKNTLPEELLNRFDDIKADPFSNPTTTLPFSNGKTGEHLFDIPGGLAIRVNREKLRRFLSSDVEIKVGQPVVSQPGHKTIFNQITQSRE